jgi:hypothetical protein
MEISRIEGRTSLHRLRTIWFGKPTEIKLTDSELKTIAEYYHNEIEGGVE